MYAAAPKAELHVQLEGSIQPTTLLTLARRNRVELPVESEAGLQANSEKAHCFSRVSSDWLTYRDFNHLIKRYIIISSFLKTVEDYELTTYEFGAEMCAGRCDPWACLARACVAACKIPCAILSTSCCRTLAVMCKTRLRPGMLA